MVTKRWILIIVAKILCVFIIDTSLLFIFSYHASGYKDVVSISCFNPALPFTHLISGWNVSFPDN